MSGWVCDLCGRRFARARQAHECTAAMTLADYFSTAAPHEQAVFSAVFEYLTTLGPVTVEPVSVGIFIKKAGSFVELRPLARKVAMSFPLARRVAHPRMVRKPIDTGTRIFHFVNLRDPSDLTDDVKGWLAESYAFVE
ncbi:MAG: DUF5655 domain-containing protein [Ilumatobacteraceae bacterium]